MNNLRLGPAGNSFETTLPVIQEAIDYLFKVINTTDNNLNLEFLMLQSYHELSLRAAGKYPHEDHLNRSSWNAAAWKHHVSAERRHQALVGWKLVSSLADVATHELEQRKLIVKDATELEMVNIEGDFWQIASRADLKKMFMEYENIHKRARKAYG